MEEMQMPEKDRGTTDSELAYKAIELANAPKEIETASQQLAHAQKLLKIFLCPKCGAPVEERSVGYDTPPWEPGYRGHGLGDEDHEYKKFACGYVEMDGSEVTECGARSDA
jgi:hypothetical protein